MCNAIATQHSTTQYNTTHTTQHNSTQHPVWGAPHSNILVYMYIFPRPGTAHFFEPPKARPCHGYTNAGF
jgi:hypothetical protein